MIEPIFNLPESSTTTTVFNMPEPIFNIPDSTVVQLIFNIPKSFEQVFNIPKPVVFQRPSPFPFENTKAVPGKYDTTVVKQRSEKVGQKEGLKIASTDIAGGSRMIHNGRIYTPQFNLTPPIPPKETTTTVTDKGKGVIPTDEDTEFPRIIKKSDYNILNQLHQTPSKISILSLLMSSLTHRIALQILLAQAHVAHDTTIDQFDGIIANITTCNNLSFSSEDLPKDGQDHNRALHIYVKFQEDTLARVLMDTGSSLDVLPKRTLTKLAYQGAKMRPNALIVKVMDINPNYSCLLGRPWIHVVVEVTFVLHQKMKFVIDDKLVIMSGEEDLMVSHLYLFSYIEVDEDALETSFQALEITNAVLMEVDEPKGKGIPYFASWKKAILTIKEGSLEGWGDVIDVKIKLDRYGLGYKPTNAKKGAPTSIRGCPKTIQEVFVSAEYQVNAIDEDIEDEDLSNLVYQCDVVLNNWKEIEIPEMFPLSKIKENHVESNDSTFNPNFDSSIYQVEEEGEEGCDVPDELERLVEYEYTYLQPHQE
ncbi:uncharacterized protein LOC127123585 [Lathyrus oleraceus]|uniref:uncharacterized protein LOC127123585 n=1 Tax=Pisum sativum TaxID=3888 RepID=UPI0021D009EE|nr:uncharacterized protein LOC127123585 [Pisum sativum]